METQGQMENHFQCSIPLQAECSNCDNKRGHQEDFVHALQKQTRLQGEWLLETSSDDQSKLCKQIVQNCVHCLHVKCNSEMKKRTRQREMF
eukprot:Gb_30761 [translate_table: standard]